MGKIFSFISIIYVLTVHPATAREFSPKKVYKKSSSAVVFVFATNGGSAGIAGTGSIIRKDGLVITNAHVVYDNAQGKPYDMVFVFLKPRRIVGDMDKDLSRRYKTRVLYYQNDMDLAVLQMEDVDGKLPMIEFADPDEISIGEDVLAIGHPEQGGLWTLTTGTISAIKANFEDVQGKDVFQTEASLNKGNSGGPLLDKRGYMVGVNSNIARKNTQGLAITDINFSIKADVTIKWLKSNGYDIPYGTLPLEEPEREPEPEKPAVQEKPIEQPKISEPPVEEHKEQVKEPSPVEQSVTIKEETSPEKPKVIEKKENKKAKILTEKRPYNLDKLIKKWAAKVESEMEGVMDEMKGKVKKGTSKNIFDEF